MITTHILNRKRQEKNPRGGAEGDASNLGSLWKARWSTSLWVSIFPAMVSILIIISVFVRHTEFVLLSQTYFAKCVLFTITLKSVISVIYCPLVFI